MASARIGALRIDLGLNSASFEKGVDAAQRRLNKFGKGMGKLGDQVAGIGKGMAVGLTAPLLAVGGAFTAQIQKMTGDVKGLRVAAQVAGEDFETFQRQAYAASQVGIEYEKLGDIFKDVRERVGEFVVGGTGPLQDAFDALNGKVSLTVDELRGLSGKDALQLIVQRMEQANLSAEEMSFVLESLGSDATRLIPLLQDNAKAFDEFGNAAAVIDEEKAQQLERYRMAQEKLANSFQKLTLALVDSGLLEGITTLITRFADWITEVSKSNPELFKLGTIIGGVAAAVGPLVVIFGSVISAIGKIAMVAGPAVKAFGAIKVAALALMANPVILGFAAVLAGIYLAWKNWDKIEAVLSGLYQAAKRWLIDKLGGAMDWVRGKIKQVEETFAWLYDSVVGNSWIPDMVDGIQSNMSRLEEAMVQPAISAVDGVDKAIAGLADRAETQTVTIARTFDEMARGIMGSLRQLANGIKGGGFLDILEGALGIFSQLGSAGVFGSAIQSNLNTPSFGGALAMGGPVSAGKSYLVGERGPELFTPGKAGGITPNHAMGQTVQVVPSPYFDVVVDGRIQRSAPAIAEAGAAMAQGQMAQSARRRYR